METKEIEGKSFRPFDEACAGCGAPINLRQPDCSYCLRPHRAMRKAWADLATLRAGTCKDGVVPGGVFNALFGGRDR